MKKNFCDKCGKEIDVFAEYTTEVIRSKDKDLHKAYCYICYDKVNKAIDKLLNLNPKPKFEPKPKPESSGRDESGEGTDDAWGTNHATDRWGGAGPDCLFVPEGVRHCVYFN